VSRYLKPYIKSAAYIANPHRIIIGKINGPQKGQKSGLLNKKYQ
jgi:hypothetical protein